MRLGCFFILLVLIIPLIAFMPLFMSPSEIPAPINDGLTALICGGDKQLIRETFRASYHEPGEVGINLYCEDEQGTRTDATGRMVLVLMGSIIVPTLLMIAWGTMASKNVVGQVGQVIRRAPYNTTSTTTYTMSAGEFDQVKHSLGLGDLNLDDIVRNQQPQATGDFVAQLKQLDEAYEKRLINREEYDEARQRLLDNIGK